MTHKQTMNPSEFFFQTDLTGQRQNQIVKWFNSLTPDKQKMVRELQKDESDNNSYNDSEDQ
jgi:hypothetical protein